MIHAYGAAVRHDVASVMKVAPREILDSISVWKREGVSEKDLAWLVKTAVLNDSLVRQVPALMDLNMFDVTVLYAKPNLVRMYIALENAGYSSLLVEKAIRKALTMTDTYIEKHAYDVESFVKQLSNRDDHNKSKKKRR